MTDCIFCKLAKNEIPTEKLYEDERLFVIKDIKPKAPVHLLVITRDHIENLNDLEGSHSRLMGHMMVSIQKFAQEQGLKDYRVIANTGAGAGQEVFHLHLHILGGPARLPGF